MKTFCIIISLILLTGCINQSKLNKRKAEFLCKDYAGVYEMSSFRVTCNTGKYFGVGTVHNLVIPVEYLKTIKQKES